MAMALQNIPANPLSVMILNPVQQNFCYLLPIFPLLNASFGICGCSFVQ